MMRRFIALFLAVLTLGMAGVAQSYTIEPTLKSWASIVAMRPVQVRCYDREEPDSPWGYGAWAYVEKPLATKRWMAVDARLCVGALAVNDESLPEWQRALGALALTHEAYHMRRWGAAGDEGKVECQAIRHWKVAARMLGASEYTITDIWPTAVALHYRVTEYEDELGERPYYEPGCVVPRVIPEDELE